MRAFDRSAAARDLKRVDMFCGAGRVSQTFENAGDAAECFDVKMGDGYNFLQKAGFYKALGFVIRLAPFGILIAGPPCSYFVYMSSGFHRRTKDCPQGNTQEPRIVLSNLLVVNVTVLLIVAAMRYCFWLVEQPASSQMWRVWCLADLLEKSGARRIHTWMRCFGHPMAKPTVLWTNMPTAVRLKRVWSWRAEARQNVATGTCSATGTLPKGTADGHHGATGTFPKGPAAVPSQSVGPGTGQRSRGSTIMAPHTRRKKVSRLQGQSAAEYTKVSGNGKWISGGKNLSESAEYTAAFAAEVWKVWTAAQSGQRAQVPRRPYTHTCIWMIDCRMFCDTMAGQFLNRAPQVQTVFDSDSEAEMDIVRAEMMTFE